MLRAPRFRPRLAELGPLLLPLLAAGLGLQSPALGQEQRQATPVAEAAEAKGDFVLIRADRQSVDRQRGQVVANGNVQVSVQGWRLWADRLEYAESSRSVWVSGRVRLQKGDQYLQASSLRYSDWEGSGELLDVYGVIDRDTLPDALRGKSVPLEERAAPAFACPPLEASTTRRTALHLLPPRRESLPTIPAPPGCPGDNPGSRPSHLAQALNEVSLGQAQQPAPMRAIAEEPDEGQRVSHVQYQQSLETSIKLNLAAVIDTSDSNNSPSAVFRPQKSENGTLSRVRFQSSRLHMHGDRWSADEVAFTNDPFTPATAWTIARQVSAALNRTTGVTEIQARNVRIVLDQRVSIPAITRTSIGNEETRLALDTDRQDRDGIYLGYNLPPLRIGKQGSLELQPQFMLQRALSGETSSFIQSGAGLGSPTINQSIQPGDLFGLDGLLNVNWKGLQLNADLSLSTLNPENLPSGTRSIATLTKPLDLSWAPNTALSLFGGYRERIYNGSLGLQNLIWSYGARLAGKNRFIFTSKSEENQPPRRAYFQPLSLNWQVQSGNYQANLFESETLDTLWRTNVNLIANTTLTLWQAKPLYSGEGIAGLRFSPIAITPNFGLDMGLAGTLNYYGDGTDQNTLTLWGGPALTLGRFERPWLDYTRLAVLVGGTLRSGLSPFGFDRAVDLRTLSFSASQQIYGPLVVEGGATFNIDPDSEFYGDASYSYIEVKLQRRSYEIGVFYSPYDGIGGIRLKLNDFNFTGTGSPFVPRPAAARPLSRR
jgi:hypothetical protein